MSAATGAGALLPFSEATRRWFAGTFASPTEVQHRGWPVIASGGHALLVAPTGSGKTLAAFLWGIDRALGLDPDAPPGIRLLYVSPLKALAYDVERNLRAPLAGVQRAAATGPAPRAVRVDVRTGDTPSEARRAQARDPGEILVTTPESLFLVLGSQARETLRTVEAVVVDEIHALAATKRGAHLALSLERLAQLTGGDGPQRIGLSATVRPLDAVGRFLAGDRRFEVVDASARPRLDVRVVSPVADMRAAASPLAPGRSAGGSSEPGMWAALYPALLAEVRAHRSTIVFVNSRGLAERLAQRLNEAAGEPLVLAHHGSVSHEKRTEMEEGLERGEVRGIVATSSLELGIDMGAVDRVLLVESPGSVARGLQRVGRAGHRVDATSVGRIYPKFRGDLLECAVVAQRMLGAEIEAITVPENPLDVLAQQVVAMCCDAPRAVDDLYRLVRRAAPFAALGREGLTAVLDMLSGRYPSDAFSDLTPRLSWDRVEDVLHARRGSPMISRLNAGTIPDRGLYGVFLGESGPRVGELDEEMVFESRAGDNVILGASTWTIEAITRDRVVVRPAPGEPGRMPFWHGDGPGRPVELGRALGAFARVAAAAAPEDRVEHLLAAAPLDRFAAENLAAYLGEQIAATGTVPSDRAITVERFRDELGDWRICILSPFGARVHAPWAMALERTLGGRAGGAPTRLMYTDDGIVARFADGEVLPAADAFFPDPEAVSELVTEQLGETALFAALFRENAARSLLLPRRDPRRRNPLWAQRRKAEALLSSVRGHPGFALVLETYRSALADVFDLPALRGLLGDVRDGRVDVREVETPSASPFARSLVFAYVAAFIYEQDAPSAERRAQALTLDRGLLGELLGQGQARNLLDAGAFDELEAELQHLAPTRTARDADELHDLLRRLGDLSVSEAAARATEPVEPWLERLRAEARAETLEVAGEARWIAADDAALYREALDPSPGDVRSAERLEQVLRRYARTRGPFATSGPAARFGLADALVEPTLERLRAAGSLVRGEIRPGGSGEEWCDAEVLAELKRRTLGRLRREVAAVPGEALARFLPDWQETGPAARLGSAAARVEDAVARLEGLPLPWSSLLEAVLPDRLVGLSPGEIAGELDRLCAGGRLVWVGAGRIGARDGRVALYRRSEAALLLAPPATQAPAPRATVHTTIVQHLAERGASFGSQIEDAVRTAVPGSDPAAVERALWDLVWEGMITNDTVAPLRTLSVRRASGARAQNRHAVASGRWSLVAELTDVRRSDTERALARARMLLGRYGVVSREAAYAEGLPGGFAPIYEVGKAMEEAGRVRRGYFVDGLSGIQFAVPDAVERLRAVRRSRGEPAARCLAALDPANPYGALLGWPPTAAGGDAAAPRRVAGALVVLVDGAPVLYASGRALLTFPLGVEREPENLVSALRALGARRGRRPRAIERIDGGQAEVHAAALIEAGFRRDYRAFVWERGHPA